MSEVKVYLIITNHVNCNRYWSAGRCNKRIFKKLKNYQLIDSNFVPNQMNLFIEENNKSL